MMIRRWLRRALNPARTDEARIRLTLWQAYRVGVAAGKAVRNSAASVGVRLPPAMGLTLAQMHAQDAGVYPHSCPWSFRRGAIAGLAEERCRRLDAGETSPSKTFGVSN